MADSTNSYLLQLHTEKERSDTRTIRREHISCFLLSRLHERVLATDEVEKGSGGTGPAGFESSC